jgi:Ni/Fe-hydrogenase subunit HybB-like protein
MSQDTIPQDGTYATRPAIKIPAWHGLVTWDMLCNGLTTGLFLVAAVAEFTAPDLFAPITRLAYPVALVFLIADLALLVVDLGDSWRFHHMLRMFKPGSPMSVGVWSLTVYSWPLTAVVVLGFLPEGGAVEWLRLAAVVVGLVPAFVAAAYKGVLLSTSAQPGWQDARWLGAYLTSGAFVLGGAAMTILAALASQEQAATALRIPLAVLLAIHAVPTFLLMLELWPTADRALPRGNRNLLAAVTAGKILLPLALVIASPGLWAQLTAVILILCGTFVTRHLLVQWPDWTAKTSPLAG